MQLNGTAAQFRELDTYEVDSASVSEEEDVVVFKSPNLTKFRLANALFPAVRPASATEHAKSSAGVKVIVQAELAAVEPASSTPSPAPSEEGVVPMAPLVVLKGAQFGIPGTTSKFSSRKHATPPGLVEASWNSELSAKA
jgi:hypothetical protein